MKKLFTSLLLVMMTLLITMPALAEIRFSGDARYRAQSIYMENTKDDNAQKFRLRLLAQVNPNEQVSLAARIVTGTGNARSTNVEMGNYAQPKGLFLDQMYMTYAPLSQLSVTGGRFAVPMRYTDMVFDPDVNLDGTNAHLATKFVFGNAGAYWLNHNSADPNTSQAVFMYQLGLTVPYFQPALGYYDFTHLEGSYKVADLNISIPISKITLYGDYVRNTALSEENDGYLVGLMTKFRYINLNYNYRDRNMYAVYAPLTDDDFAGGTPETNGHRINIWITPITNTKVGATYFMTHINPSTTDLNYNRLMIDAEVNF